LTERLGAAEDEWCQLFNRALEVNVERIERLNSVFLRE